MAGFIPAIHVLRLCKNRRRGWPEQVRPWRRVCWHRHNWESAGGLASL